MAVRKAAHQRRHHREHRYRVSFANSCIAFIASGSAGEVAAGKRQENFDLDILIANDPAQFADKRLRIFAGKQSSIDIC